MQKKTLSHLIKSCLIAASAIAAVADGVTNARQASFPTSLILTLELTTSTSLYTSSRNNKSTLHFCFSIVKELSPSLVLSSCLAFLLLFFLTSLSSCVKVLISTSNISYIPFPPAAPVCCCPPVSGCQTHRPPFPGSV